MWKTSEKYVILGLGYSIWACVMPTTALVGVIIALGVSVIGFCYFAASIYQSFKED